MHNESLENGLLAQYSIRNRRPAAVWKVSGCRVTRFESGRSYEMAQERVINPSATCREWRLQGVLAKWGMARECGRRPSFSVALESRSSVGGAMIGARVYILFIIYKRESLQQSSWHRACLLSAPRRLAARIVSLFAPFVPSPDQLAQCVPSKTEL